MTFAISKIFWVLAAPGHILLFLLLYGIVRLIMTGRRRGLAAIVIASLGFLSTTMLPLAGWLSAPLENRFPMVTKPPERVDGIILLGGAVSPRLSRSRGQVALNDAAERVTETVALARRYPEARIVITGGDAKLILEGLTEAEPTRDLVVALGIAPERLIIETASRNTWENAVFSREMAQPKSGETWLLVTTAMHMPRAVGCFRRAGWTVLAYPVDYRSEAETRFITRFGFPGGLEALNLAVQEWIGLVAYYALGRLDAAFPAP